MHKTRSAGKSSVIVISSCEIKVGRNEETGIVVEGRHLGSVEIRECKFSGKLRKGSKYISGKVERRQLGQVEVKNCQFETREKSTMNFEIVDDEE